MRQRNGVLAQFDKWGFDQKGWSNTTRHRYLQRAVACEMWFIENRSVSIVSARPKDFQAYLFSTTASARNRNNIRQALIAFCSFLVDSGFSELNNASALPRLPEPRPIPKALTPEQARRITAAARIMGPMPESIVYLMLFGGLRKTECRLLERKHVVDEQWLQFKGKGSRERVVPLHQQARKSLKIWLSTNPEPRWVFPSPRLAGRPISDTGFRVIVAEVGKLADVQGLHPHVLRHTFGTRLDEKGRTLREIQELMGHADPKTTAIYTRVRPGRLRDAIEALDFVEGAGSPEPVSPVALRPLLAPESTPL